MVIGSEIFTFYATRLCFHIVKILQEITLTLLKKKKKGKN